MMDLPPQDMNHVPKHMEYFASSIDAQSKFIEALIAKEIGSSHDSSMMEESTMISSQASEMSMEESMHSESFTESMHSMSKETSAVSMETLESAQEDSMSSMGSMMSEEEQVSSHNTPTEEELLAFAKDVKSIFEDGFEWSDIALIVDKSIDYINTFSSLDKKQQKGYVISIMEHVIDLTDTPWLPDRVTDPIMKSMLPPFVDLAMKTFKGKMTLTLSRGVFKGRPSEEIMVIFAKQIKNVFADGFQWADLAETVNLSVQFIHAFVDLPNEEKKQTVIELLEHVIDITDTPFLPDSLSDPIFKQMVPSFVDAILASTGEL